MTLGSSSGTNIVAIGAGTGATTVNIATGATNAKAVNIATGAVANTVAIANGAAAQTVTVGSSNTTSTLTLQAGSGNVNVVGNLVLSNVATQLQLNGGAVTDFIGTGTLTSGTVTIANTNIAAADRIFIQRIGAAASTTLGELSYSISAATSFTVTSLILGTPGSTQTGDASTFSYFIVRQN